jgi:TonB family protein
MTGRLTTLIFSLALSILLPHTVVRFGDQNAADSDKSLTGVVLVKLSMPIYPSQARATRVAGDVDLMLTVRPDGSVESVEVVSGSPLLSPAALDSVKHTQFECHKCIEAKNSFRLVYTFKIEDTGTCGPVVNNTKPNDRDQTYPEIADAKNRVTTSSVIVCLVDPASDFRRSRSLKCLYLWRCGP